MIKDLQTKEKLSGVYKITNTVTGDFYIGSSVDVKERWRAHKKLCTWKRYPNNKLYQDMQKYGVDKFRFLILASIMPEHLVQVEQELIDSLHPTYNYKNAYGVDNERRRESFRKAHNKYMQSDRGKGVRRKAVRKYFGQLCLYNGETITLGALSQRFYKKGINSPILEAKKYLIG